MADDNNYGVWAITPTKSGWVALARNIPALKTTYNNAIAAIVRFAATNKINKYSIKKHQQGCCSEYDYDEDVYCCSPVEVSKEEIVNLIKRLEL